MTTKDAADTSMTRRRVVYTALIGQYEKLNEQPIAAHSTSEFICFTDDRELTSASWTIRLVAPRFPLDPIRSARYLKMRGIELLGDYDESLWIDNSVRLSQTPELLIESWLAANDFALPLHSYRTSVLGEFDIIATQGYDDPARVYEQLIHYSTIRPEALQEVPYWTALLARRHTDEVVSAMQLWNDHVMRYSRRDQLSINFVLKQAGLPVNAVEIDNWKSDWHEWPILEERKWHITQDRLASALRIPAVKIGELQNTVLDLRDELEHSAVRAAEENEENREALRTVEQQFKSSWSWRATAPLRAVMSFLSRR